jgi:hypothetical protein
MFGGLTFMLRGNMCCGILGDELSEEPYRAQLRRANAWLAEASAGKLLVLEIGAGFNTPSVVRWPMERIVQAMPEARFVRINLTQPEVPAEIEAQSVSLSLDAGEVITAIHHPSGIRR